MGNDNQQLNVGLKLKMLH